MKKLGDVLTAPEAGSEIMIGNSALVRGMLEAGVRVVASYPGSPTPEIATAIQSIPLERNPLYFEFSVNEKVATEVAFGAAVNGHLSCVFFKSVGLNVAADTFVQLSLMELIGGMVIVLGDDPGINSSQNEQDNRHYARLAYTPVFEPADPQETYEMFLHAAKLSQAKRMPIILRMTTHVCHAKQRVAFGALPSTIPDDSPRFNPANGPYFPITSAVFPLKRKALEKFADLKAYVETYSNNRIESNDNPERGIIAWGLPYLSLKDVLRKVEPKPDILRLGIVHPLPRRLILEFLHEHQEVKILEELDDFVEQAIKALAYEERVPSAIIGKHDIEDWIGEYTPDKVASILHKTWPDLVPDQQLQLATPMTPRPAQLCPGCGHRSAFYAVKKALASTDITVADIGCHSLGHFPPYAMGQVLLCMGHANGTAAGLSLFQTSRKVVAFIGDSTLFHAGLPGIINAVFNNHPHTLIVLDNGTTAMTGHQTNPGSVLDIEKVLAALGVKSIRKVDAYNQQKLIESVKAAVAEDLFSVIIAHHPCMLKQTRETRRAGKKLPPPVVVTEDCVQHYECISEFACPSYQLAEDGSVSVHESLCIGDGSCLKTCPAQAITLQRRPK